MSRSRRRERALPSSSGPCHTTRHAATSSFGSWPLNGPWECQAFAPPPLSKCTAVSPLGPAHPRGDARGVRTSEHEGGLSSPCAPKTEKAGTRECRPFREGPGRRSASLQGGSGLTPTCSRDNRRSWGKSCNATASCQRARSSWCRPCSTWYCSGPTTGSACTSARCRPS